VAVAAEQKDSKKTQKPSILHCLEFSKRVIESSSHRVSFASFYCLRGRPFGNKVSLPHTVYLRNILGKKILGKNILVKNILGSINSFFRNVFSAFYAYQRTTKYHIYIRISDRKSDLNASIRYAKISLAYFSTFYRADSRSGFVTKFLYSIFFLSLVFIYYVICTRYQGNGRQLGQNDAASKK